MVPIRSRRRGWEDEDGRGEIEGRSIIYSEMGRLETLGSLQRQGGEPYYIHTW